MLWAQGCGEEGTELSPRPAVCRSWGAAPWERMGERAMETPWHPPRSQLGPR